MYNKIIKRNITILNGGPTNKDQSYGWDYTPADNRGGIHTGEPSNSYMRRTFGVKADDNSDLKVITPYLQNKKKRKKK